MFLSLETFELLLHDTDLINSIFFALHRVLLHTQFIDALFSDIDFLDQDQMCRLYISDLLLRECQSGLSFAQSRINLILN